MIFDSLVCPVCNAAFSPLFRGTIYCSARCRRKARIKRRMTSGVEQARKKRQTDRNPGLRKRIKANQIRKRKDFILNYKKKHSCVFCEESCPECLDFHHKEQSKKSFSISEALRTHSIDNLVCEIEKCVVLCANCHRKLHAGLLSI